MEHRDAQQPRVDVRPELRSAARVAQSQRAPTGAGAVGEAEGDASQRGGRRARKQRPHLICRADRQLEAGPAGERDQLCVRTGLGPGATPAQRGERQHGAGLFQPRRLVALAEGVPDLPDRRFAGQHTVKVGEVAADPRVHEFLGVGHHPCGADEQALASGVDAKRGDVEPRAAERRAAQAVQERQGHARGEHGRLYPARPPPGYIRAVSWYETLLQPVDAAVSAAWARIPGCPADPASVPRAGLGGAVVLHVARGWGTRRWQEAGGLAVALVEATNQRVHLGPPDEATRQAWLSADSRVLRLLATRAARGDEVLLRRVAERLAGEDVGASAVPEAVLFLRAAVAAGVIVAAVSDADHAALDAWAVGLGRAIEGEPGGLDAAKIAVHALSDCDACERLTAVLHPGPDVPAARRAGAGWAPHTLPDVALPDDELTCAMLASLPKTGPILSASRWLLARGGKRLRARLVLAAARAGGGDPAAALPVAAAIEWVHTASLILDDIVDEAELRRGAPALHRLTSPTFATGVATWHLTRAALDVPGLPDTLLALLEGQRTELRHAHDLGLTQGQWIEIASLKTARLFAAAAELGARAGGAPPRLQKRLHNFGLELGLGFQIVDDLLDVVGDQAALGKRPGQDVRAGRVSYPFLMARDHGADGSTDRCTEAARAHRDRAVAALGTLPGGISGIAELATMAVERRA